MKQLYILAAAACLILSCRPTPVDQPEKPDEPQPKQAVSITLDKETLSLKPGETGTLTATVEPTDATDVVVWRSSDEEVADESGFSFRTTFFRSFKAHTGTTPQEWKTKAR